MRGNPSFKVSPERRPVWKRITPTGWFIGIFALGMIALLGYAGMRRQDQQGSPVTPTLAATAQPTTIRTATAEPIITATATISTAATITTSYPATWTAGMYQDAQGQWWPAEGVREQVQKMVEEQYRECDTLFGRPAPEVYNNVTDTEIYQCYSGEMLENRFTNRKEFLDTGLFNKQSEIVTERLITIQAFSQDGLTCLLGDTYLKAYVLDYNAKTQAWDRTNLPESGQLNGIQYLGVSVVEMKYHLEDGRWKINRFIKWIPRR